MLGVAIVLALRRYGNHCHQSTVNALFVTLIFGLQRILPSSQSTAASPAPRAG